MEKTDKKLYMNALKMAVPSLFSGVANMFMKPPQRKVSSDTTALLNKQRQIAKEGLYGQDVKNEIMTDVKQADKEVGNKIKSTAVRQGLESSGIVADQLIKQGGQTTLQIARLAKEIARANEQSKIDALASASQIGQGIEDINYNNALARFQQRGGTVDAFTTAGDAFSKSLREQQEFGGLDSLTELILKYPQLIKYI